MLVFVIMFSYIDRRENTYDFLTFWKTFICRSIKKKKIIVVCVCYYIFFVDLLLIFELKNDKTYFHLP